MSNLDSDSVITLLKKVIKEKGYTQRQLAAEIGCGPELVNRWLNGRNAVSEAWRIVISGAFSKKRKG